MTFVVFELSKFMKILVCQVENMKNLSSVLASLFSITSNYKIYLWSKVACFDLFVSHTKISQTMVLHVVLLVSLESSWWIGVHWFGLRFFGVIVWKLLIIKPYSQWKLNKRKTKLYWNLGTFLVLETLNESNLIKFISQFSKLRGGRWFFSGFCCWKFKQIAKIGFGRKCATFGPTT